MVDFAAQEDGGSSEENETLSIYIPTDEEILAMAGILAFYDGDHVTLTAGKISAAVNRTGGTNAVQANAAKRPTVGSMPNGAASMHFAGTDCLTVTLSLTSFSVVWAGLVTTSQVLYEQSADANANPGALLNGSNSDSFLVNRGGTKSGKDIAASYSVGIGPFVIAHQYEGSNLLNRAYLHACTQTPNTAGSASGNPGIAAVNDVVNIGARNDAAAGGFVGELAALLIFSPALTAGQLWGVMRRMAVTYSLAIG